MNPSDAKNILSDLCSQKRRELRRKEARLNDRIKEHVVLSERPPHLHFQIRFAREAVEEAKKQLEALTLGMQALDPEVPVFDDFTMTTVRTHWRDALT